MFEKLKLRREQDRGVDTGCSKGLGRLKARLRDDRLVVRRMVVMLRNVSDWSRLQFELRSRRGCSVQGWLYNIGAQLHISRHKIGKVFLHLQVAFGSRE